MSVPSAQDLASVSGCSHHFCFGCIQKWSETENSCPLCKLRFVSIHRVKGGKGSSSKSGSGRSSHSKNPKILRVQPRNQRSEAGAALDSLLQSLTAAGGGGANRHPHHQDLGRFLLRSLGTGSSDTNARNLHNNNFNNLIHGDDPFLPGFMNVILRSTTTTTHTLAFQQQMEQFQQQQQQGGTGGRSSETAIEIDSDDDDVEVLQVTGSL